MSCINEFETVSGPYNVFRMTGEVEGIKKTIYLFFDIHRDILRQTKCDDLSSLNFQQYFMNTIKNNPNNMYDFFMEIRHNIIFKYRHSSTNLDNYIMESEKMFKMLYTYDVGNDKVYTPKKYKNLRLHHFDYRDVIDNGPTVDDTLLKSKIELINSVYNFGSKSYVEEKFNEFMKHLEYFEMKYSSIFNAMKQIQNGGKRFYEKIMNNQYDVLSVDIFSKIKNKYEHQNVKKIMNKYCDEFMKEYEKKILDIINQIKSMMLENKDRLMNERKVPQKIFGYDTYDWSIDLEMMMITLHKLVEMFAYETMMFNTRFTDMFLIRRFLDKDYIKHAISYTGGAHSFDVAMILKKLFGFKITHCGGNPDIKNYLDKHIDDSFDKLMFYFQSHIGDISTQCIDIKSIPPNFL